MSRSSFVSPLIVSPLPNGRHWWLQVQFTYERGRMGSRDRITVPNYFVTDFASIPLWRFLFWWLPMWAKYNKAAILHDYLYQIGEMLGSTGIRWLVTRQIADEIFHEAMLVAFRKHKSGRVVARLEWLGVRAFGWLSYRREK